MQREPNFVVMGDLSSDRWAVRLDLSNLQAFPPQPAATMQTSATDAGADRAAALRSVAAALAWAKTPAPGELGPEILPILARSGVRRER